MKKYLLILLLAPLFAWSQFAPGTTVRVDYLIANFMSLIDVQSPMRVGNLELTGRFEVNTTDEASKPCPEQTQLQRDALSAVRGDCVYNTDTLQVNFFDGTGWVLVGGGGLEKWETATEYEIDAVIWEPTSKKIYVANTLHTSSATFGDDIAKWDELSNPFDATDLNIFDTTIEVTDPTENMVLQVGSGQFVEVKGSLEVDDDLTVYGASNLNGVLIEQGKIEDLVGELELKSADDKNIILAPDGSGELTVKYGTNELNLDPQNSRSILENGSFERGVQGTCTDCTLDVSDSVVESGVLNNNQSLEITITASTSIYELPLNTTGIAAGEGYSYQLRIKTAAPNVEVCEGINGMVRNCQEVPSDNKWKSITFYGQIGSTSTSIIVQSAAATSGVIYLDLVEATLGKAPTAPSKSCFGDLDCENEIVFRYNLTTVVDQWGNNYPVAKTGTNNARKNIDISGIGLSNVLFCSSASKGENGRFVSDSDTSTASSLSILTFDSSNGTIDEAFTVSCTKTGSDFKPTSAQGVVILGAKDVFEPEEKILSAGLTSTQDVADLTFTELTIGAKYLISGVVRIESNSFSINELEFYSAASGGGTLYGNLVARFEETTGWSGFSPSIIFTAVSDTLVPRFIRPSAGALGGDGTKGATFLQLTRIPDTASIIGEMGTEYSTIPSASGLHASVQGGVEEQTADKWDGKIIYRRCYEVVSDITTGVTLHTIQSSLIPVGIPNFQTTNWRVLADIVDASSFSVINYTSSTGVIAASFAGSNKFGTGTRFCLRYTKP